MKLFSHRLSFNIICDSIMSQLLNSTLLSLTLPKRREYWELLDLRRPQKLPPVQERAQGSTQQMMLRHQNIPAKARRT